jgi:hypothetical protein
MRERLNWLAVIVSGHLHVAFGGQAVQQHSRELEAVRAV